MRFFKEASVAVMLLFSLSLIPFPQAYINDSLSIPATGDVSHTDTNLKLYVDGTVIKDPSGNPIRLQGFNVEPRDIDEEGVQWLKNRGFNSLRVCFYWHRLEPQQDSYSGTYFGYLDNLLNWCQEYGIYANLCFMQWQWSPYFTYYEGPGTGFPAWVISGGGYPDSASGLGECIADFFKKRGHGVYMRQEWDGLWDFVVNRYKDNPYLWAWEIFNEPTIAKQVQHESGTTKAIMDTYIEFTERVRAVDSDTIIIYHNIGEEAAEVVPYPNIVWTKSWYDVAYGGYSSGEYSQIVSRITDRKSLYNDQLGTPWIISEMGFTISDEGSGGVKDWIRDSFDVMREIGLNSGYECYGWWIYGKGTKYGFRTPRNNDGSDTWIVPILQEYL